jgi:hypothetical protein
MFRIKDKNKTEKCAETELEEDQEDKDNYDINK